MLASGYLWPRSRRSAMTLSLYQIRLSSCLKWWRTWTARTVWGSVPPSMHSSVCNIAERRSPSRACLPEVSEGCAASHLKVVIKQALVVNTQAFRLERVSSMRLLYLHKPFLSQEFKECACGKCTGLHVSRCCRLALVVTPSFRISDSTPSMRLEKSRKTSCRENVSLRPWMARSHVLPIPLVSLEMLSWSQKRATLCTSFVSVTIVSHCFTGGSCKTMLVVWSTSLLE